MAKHKVQDKSAVIREPVIGTDEALDGKQLSPINEELPESVKDYMKSYDKEKTGEDLKHALELLASNVCAPDIRRKLLNLSEANYLSLKLSNELEPSNTLEQLLIDQCASLHVVSMELLGSTHQGVGSFDDGMTAKTANKMMAAFNQKVETLIHLRNNQGTKSSQNIQVNGGQNVIANKVEVSQNEKK